MGNGFFVNQAGIDFGDKVAEPETRPEPQKEVPNEHCAIDQDAENRTA